MSSAAVHALPTAQYQQSPHERDRYYGGPSHGTPRLTQQPQHYSPNVSSGSDMTTPRGVPLPPSTTASPASPTISSGYRTASGPPVHPPPRTSSSQQSPPTTATVQGAQYGRSSMDDRRSPSQTASPYTAGYGSGDNTDRLRDDPVTAVATAAQSRRKAHQSPKHSPQQQGGSSGRIRSPVHSRSATAVGQPPIGTDLPREESTIINRLVITDPQEDIEREQARAAEARGQAVGTDITPITGLALVGSEGVDDGGRGAGKSQQVSSKTDRARKEVKFGEYFLGQTLGEGEFGKVKMGWKKEGGVQVAIKLIRRETLGSNPTRLPKIYREIAILRELQHPNIVRLHEMVETERHIGIILEYASGGELFDYILNNRYLKDGAARRLFAQLVSGVGYLHKKGIVHRDLKLENLLLDRNKNIIITDFGFANTFNPNDELGEEVENNLSSKEFVKAMKLDTIREDGHRRGDLMQTSCGSPCYAAPELVVSDSLYTGRKVDVWSCGVILYAMLAGYLPFDDDPSNPEGDNINLLYKYIVSTPLTFPEYVTPHARDLLKRILIPDPRKRADLFEVARHSWLSEYVSVVGFITSSVPTTNQISNITVKSDDPFEAPPPLARSASVREPSKPYAPPLAAGGLTPKHVEQAEQADRPTSQRDAKRRTVQLEYVAPPTRTERGEPSSQTTELPVRIAPQYGATAKASARPESQRQPEVPPKNDGYESAGSASRQQRTSAAPANVQAPARPSRETQRAASESTAFTTAPSTAATRPSTSGTMSGAMSGTRLPSHGNSYGQPAVAMVATTNAQGRFSQPPRAKQYSISNPLPYQEESIGRPSTQRAPSDYQQPGSRPEPQSAGQQQRSHKRSNTVGGLGEKIFARLGSFSKYSGEREHEKPQKKDRSHPPTSMSGPLPNTPNNDGADIPAAARPSTESRRTSFGFGRRTSNVPSERRSSRRFSGFLPSSFSITSFGRSSREPASRPVSSYMASSDQQQQRRPSTQMPRSARNDQRPQMAFGRGASRSPSQSTESTIPALYDSQLDNPPPPPQQQQRRAPAPLAAGGEEVQYGQVEREQEYYRPQTQETLMDSRPQSMVLPQQQQQQQQQQQRVQDAGYMRAPPAPLQQVPGFLGNGQGGGGAGYAGNGPSGRRHERPTSVRQQQQQQRGDAGPQPEKGKGRASHLQKNKRFGDYEGEIQAGGRQGGGHHGSSGAARRVMDFFRKRGKARGGE